MSVDNSSELENNEYTKSMTVLGEKFLLACENGDLSTVETIIKDIGSIIFDFSIGEKGKSSLHTACEHGHIEIVRCLLNSGHPWNAVDENYCTAGEYAEKNGHMNIYEELLNHAITSELILGLIERKNKDNLNISNKDYLNQKLKYSEDKEKLLDEDNNAVMMGWEKPLMVLHADIICPKEGLNILNVGFGLGIIDEEIQKRKPKTHTIIEAHPDVYNYMIESGWDKKPGVKILFGRWQDVVDQLETYDGIFFDTFGEYYEDQREFHEIVPNILNQDGIFSFFNGQAGTNAFFHHVYRELIALELQDMGFKTEYKEIDIDPSKDPSWEGVKRKYWSLNKYYVPKCTFEL